MRRLGRHQHEEHLVDIAPASQRLQQRVGHEIIDRPFAHLPSDDERYAGLGFGQHARALAHLAGSDGCRAGQGGGAVARELGQRRQTIDGHAVFRHERQQVPQTGDGALPVWAACHDQMAAARYPVGNRLTLVGRKRSGVGVIEHNHIDCRQPRYVCGQLFRHPVGLHGIVPTGTDPAQVQRQALRARHKDVKLVERVHAAQTNWLARNDESTLVQHLHLQVAGGGLRHNIEEGGLACAAGQGDGHTEGIGYTRAGCFRADDNLAVEGCPFIAHAQQQRHPFVFAEVAVEAGVDHGDLDGIAQCLLGRWCTPRRPGCREQQDSEGRYQT